MTESSGEADCEYPLDMLVFGFGREYFGMTFLVTEVITTTTGFIVGKESDIAKRKSQICFTKMEK